MTTSGGIIADLIADGVSPALIERVADALADARAAQRILDRRRASDRDRQAARRNVMSRDSADVTGSHAPAPSLNKESPQTPKKLNPTPCVQTPRARGDYHRLPEGWSPRKPLPPKTQAKVDQWPPGTLEEELAALHRWAANAKNEAGKGRKLDWDKAWVNWIERRHDERHGRTNGHGKPMGGNQSPDGLSPTTRAARDVFGSAEAGVQH